MKISEKKFNMKYQFRPYATMQPTVVTLTGKVYEKGEHPLYTEHKIIEVVDEQGEMHYAFEDELKSDEVEKQQKVYSEEDMEEMIDTIVESVIEQFKQRSEVGIKKYNTTLDRTDLSTLEWMIHFREELQDGLLYLERIIQDTKKQNDKE
jgi:hypothetical protein